jgi:hypothetical protein
MRLLKKSLSKKRIPGSSIRWNTRAFGKLPGTATSTAKKSSIPPVESAPPMNGQRQAMTSFQT